MRGVVGRRSREIGRVGLRREKESGSQVGAGIYAMQPYWAVNDAPRHFGSCSCQNTSISFVAEKLPVYFFSCSFACAERTYAFLLSSCLTESIMFLFHQPA
jgi:hypothetical protein